MIPKSRFDQLINASNNNTSTSNSSITTSAESDTAQKQLNIFDILKQFQSNRTDTTGAVQTLQKIIQSIYDAFVVQLSTSHIISNQ